jgi:hypothetical protein
MCKRSVFLRILQAARAFDRRLCYPPQVCRSGPRVRAARELLLLPSWLDLSRLHRSRRRRGCRVHPLLSVWRDGSYQEQSTIFRAGVLSEAGALFRASSSAASGTRRASSPSLRTFGFRPPLLVLPEGRLPFPLPGSMGSSFDCQHAFLQGRTSPPLVFEAAHNATGGVE